MTVLIIIGLLTFFRLFIGTKAESPKVETLSTTIYRDILFWSAVAIMYFGIVCYQKAEGWLGFFAIGISFHILHKTPPSSKNIAPFSKLPIKILGFMEDAIILYLLFYPTLKRHHLTYDMLLSVVLNILLTTICLFLLYKIIIYSWKSFIYILYIIIGAYISWYTYHIDIIIMTATTFCYFMLFFPLYSYIKYCEEYYKKLCSPPSPPIPEISPTPEVKEERWKNEYKLFTLIQGVFPEYTVQRQASPQGMGTQRFDIYIEELKLACEYQGEQHFTPIDYFGGEKALELSKIRDWRKYKKCEKYGITIVYFYYWEELTEYLVKQKLHKWIKE
jgi:hypothetical protein